MNNNYINNRNPYHSEVFISGIPFHQGVVVSGIPFHQGIVVSRNPYHQGIVVSRNPYHQGVVVSRNPYHQRVDVPRNHFQVVSNNQYNSNYRGGKRRAFVCIKTTSGRILVLFHRIKNKWMLPGGLSNYNENYQTTAIRETKEEWGGTLNNIRHLYTTDDNAAIFLSNYNFKDTSHNQRVNIFANRTTPEETSDYGFYNPVTQKVESYSGVTKPNQNFIFIALETIKIVLNNY
jgi:hypothetical protein